MKDLVVVKPEPGAITAANRSIFNSSPRAMVEEASEIASVLADVLRKQGLCTNIQGKDYVKVEGWATLGSMLGILPREKDVKEISKGVWEASVELVSARTGIVVGCGSAICTRAEKRWSRAEDYAVRSMAITRATGKAYRLGLGWVMAMAGFSPTPQEEMPDDDPSHDKPETRKAAPRSTAPAREVAEPTIEANADVVMIFDQTQHAHLSWLETALREMQVPPEKHDAIAVKLNGKEYRRSVIQSVVNEVILEGVF